MTAVLLGAMVCIGSMAGPALAQRDPFDPVIDPNASTVDTTTGGTTTTADTTGDPSIFQPTDGSDALANTGSDVSPWMAIAYALIVLGVGALVLGRMFQPRPATRR